MPEQHNCEPGQSYTLVQPEARPAKTQKRIRNTNSFRAIFPLLQETGTTPACSLLIGSLPHVTRDAGGDVALICFARISPPPTPKYKTFLHLYWPQKHNLSIFHTIDRIICSTNVVRVTKHNSTSIHSQKFEKERTNSRVTGRESRLTFITTVASIEYEARSTFAVVSKCLCLIEFKKVCPTFKPEKELRSVSSPDYQKSNNNITKYPKSRWLDSHKERTITLPKHPVCSL